MDDLVYASLTSITAAIRAREVSSAEVVDAHLARIAEVNPSLNAVVQLCAERARAEAEAADAAIARGDELGPLHGAPITLKDSHDTAGVVTTGGTLGRSEYTPDADSTVAARLRAAGAILLGKTNTPELTLSGETDNLVYGRTNNPWNPERTPGGSSGGAAAIIAAGGSPLDMGSDTGGSIRLPSHFSGIAGLKPTAGRVPRTGHIVPWGMGALDAWTTIGPMARYVKDLALTLPIISGPDGIDPAIAPVPLRDPADVDLSSLQLAYYTAADGFQPPTDDVSATVQAAVSSLAEVVASVEEDAPPALNRFNDLSRGVMMGDERAWVMRMLERWGTEHMSPFLEQGFGEAEPTSSAEYSEALELQDQFRSEMLGFIQNYDAIVAPVASMPAPAHGATYAPENRRMFYTGPYNIAGWPGAVVRCGTAADGMPLGVQVLAHPWREDVALALAAALEAALGGYARPPL